MCYNDNIPKRFDNHAYNEWKNAFWDWVEKRIKKNKMPKIRGFSDSSTRNYTLNILMSSNVRAYFTYVKQIHELSVVINTPVEDNKINLLRDAKEEIHDEISGYWYWEEKDFNFGFDIDNNLPNTIYDAENGRQHETITGWVIRTDW